jgi:hypothetical protein
MRHEDHIFRTTIVGRHGGLCPICDHFYRPGKLIAALPEPMHPLGVSWDGRCYRMPGERGRGQARAHRRTWACAKCIERVSDVELMDTAAERANELKRQKAAWS